MIGGLGSDFIYGNQGDDSLDGNEDNDAVFGGRENDIVNGGSGNDSIAGGFGNDFLNGDAGADTIIGGRGNDSLTGGEGFDLLNGISPLSDNQGKGEIDTLAGEDGGDGFMLCTKDGNYYDDGDDNSPGLDDYALLTDFKYTLNGSDRLRLRPNVKYVASESPKSLGYTGATGLYIDTDNSGSFSSKDELIAVVLNITPTALLEAPRFFELPFM